MIMKKIYFKKTRVVLPFLALLLFLSFKAKAQCPIGNVSLSTQAQVNAFLTNYPSCTTIEGNLAIGAGTSSPTGSDITDLSPLIKITKVKGTVFIQNNDLLENLDGLKIEEIMGRLYIGGDNSNNTNKKLQNINGLSSLKSVGLFLQILNNPVLTNVNGFSGLTAVGKDIEITGNNLLSNISGLQNTTFNPNDGYGLTILGNPALAVCNLPNFCAYLVKPLGTHPRNISGNLANCLNEAAVKAACSALPVSLTTFTAKANGNYALLQWKTASEQNNKGFEIWRSGDDGKFIKISEVASQNPNTSTPTVYTFTDKSPANGNNYYKLVQIDNDGKENELAVRDLSFSLSASSLQLYPNPTTANKVTVNWGNSAVNSIKLIDLNGKLLQTIKPKLASTSAIISLVKYPAGTYLLRVEGDQRVEVKKVVKL